MECRVDHLQQVGTDTAVFARVLRVHAAEGVVDPALHVDTAALRPVGRSAGASYVSAPHPIPSPPVPVWSGRDDALVRRGGGT
jgi:flavin reductase (DIM6/NTAB) family NADH-FMN oxidoreductase RutF